MLEESRERREDAFECPQKAKVDYGPNILNLNQMMAYCITVLEGVVGENSCIFPTWNAELRIDVERFKECIRKNGRMRSIARQLEEVDMDEHKIHLEGRHRIVDRLEQFQSRTRSRSSSREQTCEDRIRTVQERCRKPRCEDFSRTRSASEDIRRWQLK